MDKIEIKSRKDRPLPLHVKLLKEELLRRTRSNPQYSLRSFAKQLDIDASLLSKILKDTRKLSSENAKKIIQKSLMPKTDKKLFWSSLIQEREGTYEVYNEEINELSVAPEPILESLLPNDAFSLIAEPQHYILTELTRTRSFKSDLPSIAKKLKLTEEATSEIIQRLIRVGLIKKEGEKLVRSKGRFTTSDKEVTDSALKHHQRKVIELSVQALDEVPIEKRAQNSMTIAINPKKIPIAKQMIQDFINQLSSTLESGDLDEVYQISVGLFPTDLESKSLEKTS